MRLTVAQVDKLKQLIHDVEHRNMEQTQFSGWHGHGPYHCDYEDFADEVCNVVADSAVNVLNMILKSATARVAVLEQTIAAQQKQFTALKHRIDMMWAGTHDGEHFNIVDEHEYTLSEAFGAMKQAATHDIQAVNSIVAPETRNATSQRNATVQHDTDIHDIQRNSTDEQEMDEFGPFTRE